MLLIRRGFVVLKNAMISQYTKELMNCFIFTFQREVITVVIIITIVIIIIINIIIIKRSNTTPEEKIHVKLTLHEQVVN